jgi:putative two-component system response regulator
MDTVIERVLVIDDEPAICDLLERYLGSRGYDVRTAGSGSAAIDLAGDEPFAIALCDVRMPGMNGLETVRRLGEIDPEMAVIMVTGADHARTAMDAVDLGVMDYLVKPVEMAEVEAAVQRGLNKRRLLIDQRRVERIIREEVAERTAELEAERHALRSLTVSVAESLVNALETKDPHLRGHSQRVAAMAAAVGEHLGLDAETVEQLRLAGRLHDVGTIGVREAILNKPGSLTPDEVAHVREHVRIGVEILAPLRHLGAAQDFVRDHHERWDGDGYPRRRAGTEISIGGRILAACDTFDALTSTRPYRTQRGPVEALGYMRGLVGTVLDPAVFDALEEIIRHHRTLEFIDNADGVLGSSLRLEGERL